MKNIKKIVIYIGSSIVAIAIILGMLLVVKDSELKKVSKVVNTVNEEEQDESKSTSNKEEKSDNARKVKNEPKEIERAEVTEEVVEENKTEYIFPYSDTEYLKDSDLEKMDKATLALARNEIIARHGRIFKDPIFKDYFENKSWYKGTIQPETFDENYNSELNEIEKKNIELIQKYENAGSIGEQEQYIKSMVEEYYSDMLAAYKREEANSFSGSPIDINPIYYQGDFSDILYYTVVDMAGDGVPELLIGGSDGRIYDAWAVSEEYNGEIMSMLPKRNGFHIRLLGDDVYQVYLAKNNVFKVTVWDYMEHANSLQIYKVPKHGTYGIPEEGIIRVAPEKYGTLGAVDAPDDECNYYYETYKFNEQNKQAEADTSKQVTKEFWNEMDTKYAKDTEIVWLKVSEYSS